MNNDSNLIDEFNKMCSNQTIDLLKIIFFFSDNETRKSILILIKFFELKNCLDGSNALLIHNISKPKESDFNLIITSLKEYIPKEQLDNWEQIQNMIEISKLAGDISSENLSEENLMNLLFGSSTDSRQKGNESNE